MSLLLEALKKAEKAKEEAQRRAREGNESPEAPAKAAVTRDKMPQVPAAPPALRPEEVKPPTPTSTPRTESVALELEPDLPTPKPRSAPKPAPVSSAAQPADTEAAGRASAKRVFEAKFREPNPRMPFYITLGALSVFTVGTVGYFWYQLRPPPSLVNLNPVSQAQTAQAAEPQRAPTMTATPAPATQTAIPGLPSAPTRAAGPASEATPALKTPVSVTPRSETAPVDTPRLTPRLQPQRQAPAASAVQTTVASRQPAQVNPRVQAGYSAYMAGDLAASRTEYEQALRDEPANRDALLGLAAINVRGGRYEGAEALYLQALAADPRDAEAQAALMALRSSRADPLVTESRVKSLLAADPAAHVLSFTLGNQLAQQQRWAEAEQAYFQAYSAEPDNADFAYNVAVSLDHLRQTRQALEYYQRAIALAGKRGGSFDLGAARTRAAQLGE